MSAWTVLTDSHYSGVDFVYPPPPFLCSLLVPIQRWGKGGMGWPRRLCVWLVFACAWGSSALVFLRHCRWRRFIYAITIVSVALFDLGFG